MSIKTQMQCPKAPIFAVILWLMSITAIHANEPKLPTPNKVYKVVVLADWQPYYGLQNTDKPAGYAVELFELIANNAGINYEYVLVDKWSTAMQMLKEKTADIIPNVGIVGSRSDFLYFSQSTDADHIRVFSLDAKLPNHIKDITNQPIGVSQTNACVELLEHHYPQLTTKKFTTIQPATERFMNGELPYLCYPEQLIHTALDSVKLNHVEPVISTVYRGVGLSFEHFDLLPIIDNAISELRVSGELQQLHVKWFANEGLIYLSRIQIITIVGTTLLLLLLVVFILYYKRWLVTKSILQNEIQQKTHFLNDQKEQFKQQRNQAKKSEALMNSVLDNTRDLICYLNEDHEVLGINKGFCQLLNKPKDELMGQSLHSILPPDLYRILSTKINSALEFREKNTSEYWVELNQKQQFYQTDITPFIFNEALGVIIFSHDLTSKALAEKQLILDSYVDELTHANNLKAYREKIEDLIAEYQRYNHLFSFLILDVDDFKKINDQHGHKAGDKVLQGLVNTIQSHIRSNDYLYRIGGEEFVILFSNTPADKAVISANKLCKAISQNVIDDSIRITISAGMTEINKQDTDDTLFKRGDKALYEAKAQGKNRVVLDY